MEFGVLGSLSVRAGGAEVGVRRGSSRTLLAALLLRVGETVSASTLMEILWGESLPRNPANALQIQVSYLRKTLAAPSLDGRQPIVTRAGGYSLEVDPASVDAVRFERAVAAVAPAEERTEARALADLAEVEAALGLWRGDALEDVAGMDFAVGAATRLEEMRWRAQEVRIDLLLALGRHREAAGELGALVAAQPLRESFREQLMTALYRCGRQGEALRAYESARQVLLAELGLDPGPGLQRLERAVLAQDSELDWMPLRTEGLASAASPPPAEWKRSFVPAPTTPLIGRATEVDRIGELVERSRLVTLTGPGGAGKSRLAIEVARQAMTGQVWYVDLGPVDLPDLVGPTVAAALGASTGPNEDPAAVVAATLATETGLLVLDTCEHVLAGAAAVASAILRRAPGLTVLATSRRPLGLAGEATWPVPPLGVAAPDAPELDEIRSSPAVMLFCARAQGVRPDFQLTAENARDVAGICLTLDGLPLAIELAAARTDVLSPATILARLQNRFDLLVDGAADAALRQQTLRGAIDWSVELLTDEQRCFFARLGAFAGGFELEAAEIVAGHGLEDPQDLLFGLVRHSMVVADGEERFHLLDTLRAYAVDLLAELDADEAGRRHAEHYALLAERSEPLIRTAAQAGVLAQLRADSPNLQAALEWSFAVGDLDVAARIAGALAWFWTLEGRLDLAARQLERAVAIEGTPPAIRARLLWGYALLVSGLGDLERARWAGFESVRLARETGDDAAIGTGLNSYAVATWALGDLEASALAHDEAIERFAQLGDVWGEAICRVLRTRTAIDRDEPGTEEMLRAALGVARRSGDAHVLGLALQLCGSVESSHGDRKGAIATVTESLRLQESIGYAEGTVSALHALSRLHLEGGEDDEARALVMRTLRLAWKMQHAAAICEALEDLAHLEVRAGRCKAAVELLTVAANERAGRHLPSRTHDREALEALHAGLAGEAMSGPLAVRPLEVILSELIG